MKRKFIDTPFGALLTHYDNRRVSGYVRNDIETGMVYKVIEMAVCGDWNTVSFKSNTLK